MKAANGKKKIKGSHIKHNNGKTKKLYIISKFFEYLTVDKFKNVINPKNIKTSFLTRTSNSAIG